MVTSLDGSSYYKNCFKPSVIFIYSLVTLIQVSVVLTVYFCTYLVMCFLGRIFSKLSTTFGEKANFYDILQVNVGKVSLCRIVEVAATIINFSKRDHLPLKLNKRNRQRKALKKNLKEG